MRPSPLESSDMLLWFKSLNLTSHLWYGFSKTKKKKEYINLLHKPISSSGVFFLFLLRKQNLNLDPKEFDMSFIGSHLHSYHSKKNSFQTFILQSSHMQILDGSYLFIYFVQTLRYIIIYSFKSQRPSVNLTRRSGVYKTGEVLLEESLSSIQPKSTTLLM